MSLGARIAARRREQEKLHYDVEQWGEDGEPLRLYYSEVSARDMEKLNRKHPNFLANTTLAGMVDLIIMKAEGANGDLLFTLEDKPHLMGEPGTLIAEIFSVIFAATSVEDHEKN